MSKESLYICVDFDGTAVTHDYPYVGKDIGAVPVLKRLVEAGHKLIVFTMRSGKQLDDVVDWYKNNDIPLFGINVNPTQTAWTKSPKAYGHLYIDDAALGCPTINDPSFHSRPYVNWVEVENKLLESFIL